MTILVFGRTGQVARELRLREPGIAALGRDVADLTDPAACAAQIRDRRPSAVINAAAYTAVDKAEEDAETAMVVNGHAPRAMAGACAAHGVPFVHISTDYVFDGHGSQPWRPEDATAPLGVYGRTKLAGEQGIVAAGGTYAILRTSWVFSAHGSNFVKTMLRLSETRDALDVVDDQVGGPTPADAIAAACLTMANELRRAPEKSGTCHFAGTPAVSWKDFAVEIFARAGRDVTVRGIASEDYPTPAERPRNSRLDCAATEAAFGLPQPDWRDGLDRVLLSLQAG